MPGKSASMEIFFVSLYYRLFYFIVLDEGGLHLLKVKEKNPRIIKEYPK